MQLGYTDQAIFGDKVILESADCDCNMYFYRMEDGLSRLRVYRLFPGIYVVFSDIRSAVVEQQVAQIKHIYVLEYCLSGAYEVAMEDGRKFYLSEGDALFHSYGDRVIWANMPTKRYRGVSIFLDLSADFAEFDAYLSVFNLTSQDFIEVFKKGERASVVSPSYDLKKMFADLSVTNALDKVRYYRLKVTEIFLLMIEGQRVPQTFNLQQSLLEHIVEHMRRDLAASLSIRQLAKEHGVSLTSLNHYFKATYQMTPYQYLKKLRLEVASKMLKTSQCPVTEIASSVGFQNPSKFAIAFKAKYSLSPTDYRKKYFWS